MQHLVLLFCTLARENEKLLTSCVLLFINSLKLFIEGFIFSALRKCVRAIALSLRATTTSYAILVCVCITSVVHLYEFKFIMFYVQQVVAWNLMAF